MSYPNVYLNGEQTEKIMLAWSLGDDQPFMAWQGALKIADEVDAAAQEKAAATALIDEAVRDISYQVPRKRGVFCDDCSKYRVKGRLVAHQVVDLDLNDKQRVCGACLSAAVNRVVISHPTVMAASAKWLLKRDELKVATADFMRTIT